LAIFSESVVKGWLALRKGALERPVQFQLILLPNTIFKRIILFVLNSKGEVGTTDRYVRNSQST
jgi:hypothetical protein